MHLKNFSLLVDEAGLVRLTSAYDLVCTRLVIENDPLALPVMGKKDDIGRGLWLKFAEYCQLSARIASRVLDTQSGALTKAIPLLDGCFLPAELKAQYRQLIEERSAQLQASGD